MKRAVAGSGAELRVVRVENEPEFQALAETWNMLASRTDPACVFLRHEWFDSVWQWRRSDCRLRVLCAYRDETLVGICPLVATAVRRSFLKVSGLTFLTGPDTQFCDLLAAPEDRTSVSKAVAAELHARRGEWDVLDLRYLAARSTTLTTLAPALQAQGFAVITAANGTNPYISLQGGWEAYYRTCSRSLKKANNLCANRLNKAGAVEVVWLNQAPQNADELDDALANIVHLSSRSWKQATGLSLDHEGPGRFIRTLTRHAAERGWISIWLLTLDARLLAMEYQLAYGGQVYALRSDFDAAGGDISPGSHLSRTLLERLFASGYARYYMGPGDNAYKARWTDEGESLHLVRAYGTTLAGHAAWLLDRKLRPAARRLRQLVRETSAPNLGKTGGAA